MSELERIVAWAFRARRRGAMPSREFCHELSLGQRWFTPAEAQKVLERALEAQLLEAHGEDVRPAFDVEDVELPLGFRGSRRALEEPLPVRAPPSAQATAPAAAADRAPIPSAVPVPPVVPAWPGPHAALLARAPADRVQGLLAQTAGRLDEDAARLLALREQGEDVRAAAAAALAALEAASPALSATGQRAPVS